MFQIFRRIGFFRRRWIWALLLIAGFGLVGYWMVPWRGAAADLQLLALRPDGTYASTLRAAPAGVDDSAAASARARAIPLVLAVANSGVRGGRPERLVLALPRWYRLSAPGHTLRNEVLPDELLQRYVIELDSAVIESGRVPTLLPGVDTLWLEPYVPDFWCTADEDSVPQLIPSTPPDTSGTVSAQVFWSFEGRELADRQTGLLTVQLPGAMFRRRAPAEFAQSPVELGSPRAPRPEMGVLVEGGTRYAECGAPGDPMRIFSALWITPSGGRMVSIHYGGLPRKEYYDLNRDSVFELEMWDPDGDGDMEAWRTVRLPIPDYMLPEDPIVVAAAAADSARADSLRTDSLRADSLPLAGMPILPAAAGARPDLAMLSRMLVPGDVTRARRLFVPEPPPAAPVVREDEGPLGTPLGGEAADEVEVEVEVEGEEAEAEAEGQVEEEEEEEEEGEPDLIERTLREAAEREQDPADEEN